MILSETARRAKRTLSVDHRLAPTSDLRLGAARIFEAAGQKHHCSPQIEHRVEKASLLLLIMERTRSNESSRGAQILT